MPELEIRGGVTKVDAEDLEWLQVLNLYVDSQGYVAGCFGPYDSGRLHRRLISAKPGTLVDHINRDRLDNRRSNLRIIDRNGNARNSKFRSHNTSGYRGVYLCRCTNRWRAEIRVDGRGIKLGRFDDVVEAARAYDRAAIEHHGQFAQLNFPHEHQEGWRSYPEWDQRGGCD